VPGDCFDSVAHCGLDPVLELINVSTTWEEDEDGVLGAADVVQEGDEVLCHQESLINENGVDSLWVGRSTEHGLGDHGADVLDEEVVDRVVGFALLVEGNGEILRGEVLFPLICVEGGTHDDELELGTALQAETTESNSNFNIGLALVEFIKDDVSVGRVERRAKKMKEKSVGGHVPQLGVGFVTSLLATDPVANLITEGSSSHLGDVGGDGHGGSAARLGAGDAHSVGITSQQGVGDSRTLSRTSVSADEGDVVLLDDIEDVVQIEALLLLGDAGSGGACEFFLLGDGIDNLLLLSTTAFHVLLPFFHLTLLFRGDVVHHALLLFVTS